MNAVTFLPSTSPDESTVVSSPQVPAEEQQTLLSPHAVTQKQSTLRKRSRWLIAGILIGLLLLVGGGLAVFFLHPPSTGSSPPTTLDAVCHDLQQHNYQGGYHYFSSSFQQVVSEPEFTRYFTGSTSCAYSPPQQAGSTATTQLTTSFPSGQTTIDSLTLQREGIGTWIIQAAPTLSTPARTLAGACTALIQGQYHTAYTFFSSTYQKANSEQAFTDTFSGGKRVVTCSPTSATLVGPHAIAQVALQRTDGSQEQDKITLIQDETNHWKIDIVEVHTY